jgi:hypothetical protein
MEYRHLPSRKLVHVCHAAADAGWVHGLLLPALGLGPGQYRTRADDEPGALEVDEIARAVDGCRSTILVVSDAARWDQRVQLAATLAQHLAVESRTPRLVVILRDPSAVSDAGRAQLPLGQRALVALDCSSERSTTESLRRLRAHLGLEAMSHEAPECPYPGLDPFTEANSHLLFGRDADCQAILQRVRQGHTRILLIGPSGSGKSSLLRAAVLPALRREGRIVTVVERGTDPVTALRASIAALEVPGADAALDDFVRAQAAASGDAEQARAVLVKAVSPDPRRRVLVIDALEEILAENEAPVRDEMFGLLGGLWSWPWCTVLLCMRADFYGAFMAERCWSELESSQVPLRPLDEAGLRAAIIEPARRVGVHLDGALVERLIREVDRDRSSVPLPLLQVALRELWARVAWRYITLESYERIVAANQHGLAAVLAVHADGILQTLTAPGDRMLTQRILLDLIHLGEGRPHTRRRRTLEELRRAGDAAGQLERVLDRLVKGRLITTSDGDRSAGPTRMRHFDLAHDALIASWRELSEWVQHRQSDLIKQRRFEAWAREWVDGNRTSGLLDEGQTAEVCAWRDSPGGIALGVSPWLFQLIEASTRAHAQARHQLAVLYSKMGGLAVAAHELGAARQWFEKAVDALADAGAGNPMSQRDLLVAHLNVALTEPHGPERHVAQATAIYERLRRARAFAGDAHFEQIGVLLDHVRRFRSPPRGEG